MFRNISIGIKYIRITIFRNDSSRDECCKPESGSSCSVIFKPIEGWRGKIFLKTEALKQSDGDCDILYRNIKNHTFTNGLDLESIALHHLHKSP